MNVVDLLFKESRAEIASQCSGHDVEIIARHIPAHFRRAWFVRYQFDSTRFGHVGFIESNAAVRFGDGAAGIAVSGVVFDIRHNAVTQRISLCISFVPHEEVIALCDDVVMKIEIFRSGIRDPHTCPAARRLFSR